MSAAFVVAILVDVTNTHPPSSEPSIVVDGLTKRYRRTAVVSDLSFRVRRGTVTGLLGPNGAGKTTALKAIVGLSRPSSGQVFVNGRLINTVRPDARLLGVSMDVCGAHPGRSARTHLRALAAAAELQRSRVDDVLALVELDRAASKRAGKLSLGMQQRLGLAAALLGDPQILVLDEPINGLDPQGIRWLRTMLRSRAESGRTVLLSSHALAEVGQTVDDVVVIDKGRLLMQGPIDDLVSPAGASLEDVFVNLIESGQA